MWSSFSLFMFLMLTLLISTFLSLSQRACARQRLRIVVVSECKYPGRSEFERTMQHTLSKPAKVLEVTCSFLRPWAPESDPYKNNQIALDTGGSRVGEPRSWNVLRYWLRGQRFHLALRLQPGTRPAANESRSRHGRKTQLY